ncbi:hypothetical protein BN903_267 [Halorubrum sp. AJ67]|nr:hypothetical protein BN903_267 [Halorubrum sp. AJ67]
MTTTSADAELTLGVTTGNLMKHGVRVRSVRSARIDRRE